MKKYILKYIEAGVDIEIYSLKHEEYPEQRIRDEFAEDYYKKWKLSVYLVNSKRTLHARSIQGAKYIIQIDRGLSVFGRDGKTFQTWINIFENKDMPRIILKDSELTEII